MDLRQFENKVILITGAASGFGRLLSERLASAGAKLVLADINEQDLARLQESLPTTAGLVAVRCDVSVENDVQALVARAADEFGVLDIAINNAGIAPPLKAIIDVEEAQTVATAGLFSGIRGCGQTGQLFRSRARTEHFRNRDQPESPAP